MSLKILRKFLKPNICHFVGWKTVIQQGVENLFFSFQDFSSLERSSIIYRALFQFKFVHLCYFCVHYLSYGLNSDFVKFLPHFNLKYIQSSYSCAMLLTIKLTSQLIFLLEVISFQVVKTEYFPCDSHFILY